MRRELQLQEVYEGLYDGPHATPKPTEEGPIFLGIKNITEDGRLDLTNIRHISESEWPKWTKRVTPRAGDIVFSYEATLHRYAIIPEGFRGCLGRRMALIRPDNTKVNTEYLFYYFFSDDWRQEVSKYILTGATVDRIPLTKAPEFRISLPPKEQQDEVAGIISAYDKLIENNNRRIAILEEMAQSLYREWFVKFRFPGHENAKFIDSPLGKIPEGWEVKSVGELLEFDIGGGWGKDVPDEKHTESAYVIRGTDLQSAWMGDIDTLPYRYHTKSNIKSRRLQENDIVFEASGGSKGQPVGRTTLITKELVGAVGDDMICASFCKLVRAKSKAEAYILLSHIREIYADERILKYQVQSTGISNFKFKVFCESEYLVVPRAEMASMYEDYYADLASMVQKLAFSNRNLKKQRDLLLPKLISGIVNFR